MLSGAEHIPFTATVVLYLVTRSAISNVERMRDSEAGRVRTIDLRHALVRPGWVKILFVRC